MSGPDMQDDGGDGIRRSGGPSGRCSTARARSSTSLGFPGMSG